MPRRWQAAKQVQVRIVFFFFKSAVVGELKLACCLFVHVDVAMKA